MFTPKQVTEHLLAGTYVRGEWVDLPACIVWFDIKQRYAPDVLVQLYYPESMRNPLVTTRLPGVSLRTALEDVARFCGVTMSIEEHGHIVLAVPRRVEAMKHSIVLEPDPKTWIPVQPKFIDQ